MSTINNVIEKYNRLDLLKIIGALQLIPENHGKNIRLEILAQIVIQFSNEPRNNITHKELCEIFESGYTEHYLEDPISSFFTENVIFFGGNYIVFPGINNNGTRILNFYLEGIFAINNTLPNEFKEKIYQGVIFILTLSQSMASQAGLIRYLYEEDDFENIFIPEEESLNILKRAITISEDEINSILIKYKIQKEIISYFLIDPKEITTEDYDPDENPLIQKPITLVGNEYIFLLPSAIVNCLIEYIKKVATEMLLLNEINKCYFNFQWHKLVVLLYEMNWQMTDIKLPEKNPLLKIREAVFRFDNDKLAYVQFIEIADSDAEEISIIVDSYQNDEDQDLLEKRKDEVLSYLINLNKPVIYRYLTLAILGESGKGTFFKWNKPSLGNQSLAFIFGDFEKLIYEGNIDELTLWKFAKAHLRASEKTRFVPFSSLLDLYVMYKNNDGSLLPSDSVPIDFMHVAIGTSDSFERDVIKKRDEHSVLKYYKNRLVHTPVKIHKDYAPIYEERERTSECRLLITNYSFPLWVVNTQSKIIERKNAALEYIEAIAFWLYKLYPSLKSNLDVLEDDPIEIHVELESKLLGSIETFKPTVIKPEDIDIIVSVNQRHMYVSIPYEIVNLLVLSDNEGERAIIRAILHGFNKLLINTGNTRLSSILIEDSINKHLPIGNAKMILFIDSSRDLKLDNRWLLTTRYIQDVDTSYVLDNMLSYLGVESSSIPEMILDTETKNKLCNKIVSGLINELLSKLKQYNAIDLIKWLMEFNDSCTFNREFRKIRIPAKIACFSSFPKEVDELLKKEKKFVNTSISIRCLIEFVAADPHFGTKLLNFDDLDEMMSLMNEIILWGMISDSISLGMNDPEMGLLPSGRIFVNPTYFENYLEPFRKARTESDIGDYVNSFDSKFKITDINEHIPPEYTPEEQEINEAFIEEWGISLTRIMNIKGIMAHLVMESKSSVLEIEEDSLIKALLENKHDITREEIVIGLKLLCLGKRPYLTKAPEGFEKDDIYPWKYNRALSLNRRPIVKIIKPDGKTYYYCGFRHLLASAENLQNILFNGRLKAKEGGLLSSILAKVNAQKGTDYRSEVYEWLKKNSSLRIIDYEVKICENGHLIADKDYGDIDILAIDEHNKIIYSIECKDTVEARVIHEMKTELDKYLGRDGNTGMIDKHVERHKWLNLNKERLTSFITNTDKYIIKSVILSSNEIPIIYLAKEILPLPMVSFKKLNREGIILLSSF